MYTYADTIANAISSLCAGPSACRAFQCVILRYTRVRESRSDGMSGECLLIARRARWLSGAARPARRAALTLHSRCSCSALVLTWRKNWQKHWSWPCEAQQMRKRNSVASSFYNCPSRLSLRSPHPALDAVASAARVVPSLAWHVQTGMRSQMARLWKLGGQLEYWLRPSESRLTPRAWRR